MRVVYSGPDFFSRTTTVLDARALCHGYPSSLYMKEDFKMFTNESHYTILTFNVPSDWRVPILSPS